MIKLLVSLFISLIDNTNKVIVGRVTGYVSISGVMVPFILVIYAELGEDGYKFSLEDISPHTSSLNLFTMLNGSSVFNPNAELCVKVSAYPCFGINILPTSVYPVIDDVLAHYPVIDVSTSSTDVNVNPYIKGAQSCELYINGVLTDTFLPFDSYSYWFGTGTNYLSPTYSGAGGPRFGVIYNESGYYTDKLNSDNCKLNSIIRLHTYTDYIIFR